jgi:hypothetical protein
MYERVRQSFKIYWKPLNVIAIRHVQTDKTEIADYG